MVEKRLVVDTGDGPMTTFVWHPDDGLPVPAIVVYHDGPGLRDDVYGIAKKIAEHGYYAALPDLYHRSGQLLSFDFDKILRGGPDEPETQRVVKTIMETSVDMMAADTYALLDALNDESAVRQGPKYVVGFCHTARTVIRVMAERPDDFVAGSMLHPSFCVIKGPDSPHLEVKNIRGRIYAGFAGDDQLAPLDEQQPLIAELERPEIDSVVEILPGANHGYPFPSSDWYNEPATKRAWKGTFAVFEGGVGASA
jgi:carboxymethylenebutenolidase